MFFDIIRWSGTEKFHCVPDLQRSTGLSARASRQKILRRVRKERYQEKARFSKTLRTSFDGKKIRKPENK